MKDLVEVVTGTRFLLVVHRIWLAVAIALALVVVLAKAAHAQGEGPRKCYALQVLETLPGYPPLGFDEEMPWWIFICPAGERPGLEPETPLRGVLDALAKRTADGEAAFWAGQLATWSTHTLHTNLCRAVVYARSIEKFQPDPKPRRNRTAKEVKAWLLDLTGPGRPPEAQRLRPLLEGASPQTLKAWHDAAKAVWPQVALAGCPHLEPPEN